MAKPIKVFLVDDDPIYVYATRKLIELNHHDVQVQSFENGYELLDALNAVLDVRDYPDYIFLDINMPVMNGWEFLEAYEKDIPSKARSIIKIFIVTSSDLIADKQIAEQSVHVSSYLVKPLKKELLLQIFTSVDDVKVV